MICFPGFHIPEFFVPFPLAYTSHYTMEDWYDEYRGGNGAAIPDTPGKAMRRDENHLKYLKRSVTFRLGREKNVGVN